MDEVISKMRWTPPNENPLGILILNCQPYTRQALATTPSKTIAQNFSALRSSVGLEYKGKLPPNSLNTSTSLEYPFTGRTQDGPLFKAETMEHKWDLYLYDATLYFVRSWTGGLTFVAPLSLEPPLARINNIYSDANYVNFDGDLATGQVDFLIKILMFHRVYPFPLPKSLPDDPHSVAVYAFEQYGEFGAFATYENTTRFKIGLSA